MITPDLTEAIIKIAVVGALAGFLGGIVGSLRSSILGSLLMGAIGGVSLAAIIRISNLDPFTWPLLDAGGGFSYAWSAIGGLLLGYVVTRSSG
jgi:hypothetical protein